MESNLRKSARNKGPSILKSSTNYKGKRHRVSPGRNIFHEPAMEPEPVFSKEIIRKQFTRNMLLKKLRADFAKRDSVSTETVSMANQVFEQTYRTLACYQPDHIGLEFTNEYTLYLYAEVKNWAIHMETDFEEEVFCTLSIFESDEIAVNMSESVDNCLERIKKLLGTPGHFSSDSYMTFSKPIN